MLDEPVRFVPDASRDFGLDLVRILASFLVVVIHVSSTLGFYGFGRHWTAAALYDGTARASVPLFFMVSGALLLNRRTETGEMRRRILKIAIPLAAWSYVYFAWDHPPAAILSYAVALLTGTVETHLWFCYAIIGLYLFLPLLRVVARQLDRRYLLLALGLWVLNGTSTMVGRLSILLTHEYWHLGLDLEVVSLYAGYMLLGYVLYGVDWRVLKRPRWIGLSAVVWIVSSALLVAATFVTSHWMVKETEIFFENDDPLVMLEAASAFVLLQQVPRFICFARVARGVTTLARASFGVYLCHPLMLASYLVVFGPAIFLGNLWLTIPFLSGVCYVASVLIVLVLQKVPMLRLTCPG